MIAFALPALFAFAALVALASMALTWHQYGAQALAVHGALAQCRNVRELRFRMLAAPQRRVQAVVIRGAFRPRQPAQVPLPLAA